MGEGDIYDQRMSSAAGFLALLPSFPSTSHCDDWFSPHPSDTEFKSGFQCAEGSPERMLSVCFLFLALCGLFLGGWGVCLMRNQWPGLEHSRFLH